MHAMDAFLSSADAYAFDQSWSAVEEVVLAPFGIETDAFVSPVSDDVVDRDRLKAQVVRAVRPEFDSRIAGIVEAREPLDLDRLYHHGFAGPSHAVFSADHAYAGRWLSFDPAKSMIASVLMLTKNIPPLYADLLQRWGTRGLDGFRSTHHPIDELRIQHEIDRLRAMPRPFAERTLRYVSPHTLARIIEQLAQGLGLVHPRQLSGEDFKVKLPGWRTACQGLYKYGLKLASEEEGSQQAIDCLLDHLDMQRLDGLPFLDQVRILRMRSSRIYWDRVPRGLKRYLIERLATEAGVVHPRFLTAPQMIKVEIPELGSTLYTLYDNMLKRTTEHGRAVEALLDELGFDSIEDLDWEVQLKGFKERSLVHWGVVPTSTQRKLLEVARARMPKQNGMECPHLRALTSDQLKRSVIEEIDVALGGLHEHYRVRVPEGYAGTTIDCMLDELGVPAFADLSYEEQCRCLRYDKSWPWDRVPKSTIREMIERIQKRHDLPHIRYVTPEHLRTTILPEIDQSIGGLYTHFQLRQNVTDHRPVMDLIFDHIGVEPFEDMPFDLQLEWMNHSAGRAWRDIPDAIIHHHLRALMRTSGVAEPGDLLTSHFGRPVLTRQAGMLGLLTYLNHVWKDSDRSERVIDWAARRYGLHTQMGIDAKFRQGGQLLQLDETQHLIQMARVGDRRAQEQLIIFFHPLIKKFAAATLSRQSHSRLGFDDLVQLGRLELMQLAKLYDPTRGAKFTTYVYSSLPWRMMNAVKRDTGVIHRPAHYLAAAAKLFKKRAQLIQEFGVEPSDEELAQALGWTLDEVKEIFRHASREVSIHSPVGEDDSTLEDFIPDTANDIEASFENRNLQSQLHVAIEGSGLNERERFCLRKYHLEGHTLEEVGQMWGVTRERIRQIVVKAMQKIANGPYAKALKELL